MSPEPVKRTTLSREDLSPPLEALTISHEESSHHEEFFSPKASSRQEFTASESQDTADDATQQMFTTSQQYLKGFEERMQHIRESLLTLAECEDSAVESIPLPSPVGSIPFEELCADESDPIPLLQHMEVRAKQREARLKRLHDMIDHEVL